MAEIKTFSPKTGLVLEGGAMRGMFTSGITDVFMEEGIKFEAAVGVSAGATFGCNIKSCQPGRAIRYNKRFSHDKRYCSLSSLIKTGDLYGAKFCYYDLPQKEDPFDYKAYRENPMKFYCVATDVQTGKAVYHDLATCDGSEIEWMRASASMPLASRVVEIDGRGYLDGGISDSIPLEFMQKNGYEKNVVILTQPRGFVKKDSRLFPLMKLFMKKYPAVLESLKNRALVYNQETQYAFFQEKLGSVLVLCPESPLGISRTEHDANELERVYEEGRNLAKKKLEQVRNFLKPYSFYGSASADYAPASEAFSAIKNPRLLYDALCKLWCRKTCAPRLQSEWSQENRTKGQCSITAFLAQDIFGGKVYGIPLGDGNFHCYNDVGGCIFDLTSEQFGEKAASFVYSNNPEQSREVHFAKEEKKLRYEYLKEGLVNLLQQSQA